MDVPCGIRTLLSLSLSVRTGKNRGRPRGSSVPGRWAGPYGNNEAVSLLYLISFLPSFLLDATILDARERKRERAREKRDPPHLPLSLPPPPLFLSQARGGGCAYNLRQWGGILLWRASRTYPDPTLTRITKKILNGRLAGSTPLIKMIYGKPHTRSSLCHADLLLASVTDVAPLSPTTLRWTAATAQERRRRRDSWARAGSRELLDSTRDGPPRNGPCSSNPPPSDHPPQESSDGP